MKISQTLKELGQKFLKDFPLVDLYLNGQKKVEEPVPKMEKTPPLTKEEERKQTLEVNRQYRALARKAFNIVDDLLNYRPLNSWNYYLDEEAGITHDFSYKVYDFNTKTSKEVTIRFWDFGDALKTETSLNQRNLNDYGVILFFSEDGFKHSFHWYQQGDAQLDKLKWTNQAKEAIRNNDRYPDCKINKKLNEFEKILRLG